MRISDWSSDVCSSDLAEEAARRRVRMDIDVESNLPLLAFDRVQMQQVLVNLMRNAFEAMDSVSGEKVLWMRTRRIGDVVQTEKIGRASCRERVCQYV